MYHVSAQGVDERMINVHYYYYEASSRTLRVGSASWAMNSAICLYLIEEYNGQ